jgi:hypothetical protein
MSSRAEQGKQNYASKYDRHDYQSGGNLPTRFAEFTWRRDVLIEVELCSLGTDIDATSTAGGDTDRGAAGTDGNTNAGSGKIHTDAGKQFDSALAEKDLMIKFEKQTVRLPPLFGERFLDETGRLSRLHSERNYIAAVTCCERTKPDRGVLSDSDKLRPFSQPGSFVCSCDGENTWFRPVRLRLERDSAARPG